MYSGMDRYLAWYFDMNGAVEPFFQQAGLDTAGKPYNYLKERIT